MPYLINIKEGITIVGKTNNTKNDIVTLTIRKIKETGYQGISLRKLLAELHLTTGSF
ncbi:hypothetical protein [Lentilactobacillus hilgardii]|uniref:hypothetical protein n=1 Tax=Lentilactobacillus hilgardii TaxID=1588 RepID=UPI0021A7A1DB|nr:hypothetical protein [Lentilactobacillus hilgardii]